MEEGISGAGGQFLNHFNKQNITLGYQFRI
jgi:hypothetical protein